MLNGASSPISSLGTLIRHPIFLIAVAGIAIRLFIFPFVEVGYDSDFWATIIGNIKAGEGLYGLEGYYYTPVWGYILSFVSFMQESFLHIDVMGIRVPEVFLVESFTDWFFSATATSVSFNISVKIPFLISDLIVGYLVYWLIKDKTADMRKATIGFALWFLCPLVIFVTSVSGMFDTFSVLFALLCVIMIRKDKLFLGGVLFSFAVLTKFFPLFLIFILIAYIIVRHRDDGKALKSVLTAAAGSILAFLVLMAPQIIEGNLTESLLFVTTRATSDGGMISGALAAYLVGIVAAVVLAYSLSKKNREELDDSLFKYILLMVTILFMYPPTPQYLVLLIPFLAIYIATADLRLKWSWLLISVGGACFIAGGNLTLFLSLGTFTDIISLDYIMSAIEWFQTPVLMGAAPMFLIYNISGVVQYAGILSIIGLFIWDAYIRSRKSNTPFNPLRSFSSYRQPRE